MVATAFELPAVDDGDEVELAAWLVEVGESVTEGQPIAEVETEKSVVEIEVPYDGTVNELLVEEWSVVSTGQEIAIFEVDEAALDGETETTDDADSTANEPADSDADQPPEIETSEGRVFAPPRVRRLARELGVDITAVEGSDERGRITEEDVREAADSKSDDGGPKPFTPSGKSAVSKSGESVSGAGLSEKRDSSGPKPFEPSGTSAVSKGGKAVSGAGIAATSGAGESPGAHVYYETATVERLVDLVQETDSAGSESVLPFVLKALARACTTQGIDGSQAGIGVRTDDGLAVPVVSVAETSFGEVIQETADRIGQVESGGFDEPAENPAVVVTVPGALSEEYATPPLNGPTVAVSLGALEARPVVEEGQIVARETLPVSLAVSESVEPTVGAAIVRQTVDTLETPSRLLLDSI